MILNAVIGKPEYIERLKLAVEQLHNCVARHVTTTPVHEIVRGRTVWKGDVEIFALSKHPKARRCFAWSHSEGFEVALEIAPVVSPGTAARASRAKQRAAPPRNSLSAPPG